MATVPELLPCFVYGTLQTGFKNHRNVVRGRHKLAVPARLSGAVVFHYSERGFPGAYSLPGSPHFEEFKSQATDALPCSVDELFTRSAALNDEEKELAAAAGVTGQLLYFDSADWPSVASDLDELEAFFGAGDKRNMYHRQKVFVEVLEASSSAPSQPSSRRGSVSASGAGAMPEPTSTASRGPSAGTVVEAWVYFCLLDPKQPALNSELVKDGFWRRHMARTGQADAADDWSDALDKTPGE